MGGQPLSLLQLCLLLLRGCAHGEAVRLAQRQLEGGDGPAEGGGGGAQRASRANTGAGVTKGPAGLGEGGLPLDGDGISMVEHALLLRSPGALLSRLLAFGRRLPLASLLLPLPTEPRALPDARELSCLSMSQAELATRLHALIALADADDPRLVPPPPLHTASTQTASAAALSAALASAAGSPRSRRPGSAGALGFAAAATGSALPTGSAAAAARAAAVARASATVSAPARLMLRPLVPPPDLPPLAATTIHQAALLASGGDAVRGTAALGRARLAYADARCPTQPTSSLQAPFSP
jgi:hypothetical protein